MRSLLIAALGACLVAGACASAPLLVSASGNDQLKDEIGDLHSRFHQAINDRDVNAALACFTPEATYIIEGTQFEGQDQIQMALTNVFDRMRDTGMKVTSEITAYDQATDSWDQDKQRAWDHGRVSVTIQQQEMRNGQYVGFSVKADQGDGSGGQRRFVYLNCHEDKMSEGAMQIAEVSRKYQNACRDAMQQGRCEDFANLHSRDAVVHPPGDGRPIRGRDAIRRDCEETFEREQGRSKTITFTIDRIGHAGEQSADQGALYERGRYDVIGKDGSIREQGIYLQIYRPRRGHSLRGFWGTVSANDESDWEVTATMWEPEDRLARDMERRGPEPTLKPFAVAV